MKFKQLYNKVCCVMQWSIGFSRGDIRQMIREKKSTLSFTWMPLQDTVQSIADPFIFKHANGNIALLYEDFSMTDAAKYGKIRMAVLNNEFTAISNSELLNTGSHASYPFLFNENGKMYLIPETSHLGKVSAYEYDPESASLVNERTIIDHLPLLDSTIFKYHERYWLFATLGSGSYQHSKLYIYYSDSLFGTYHPHAGNPVKNNEDGSRPAGNIIVVDGELYRPAQNCRLHYGESISINRITKLTEQEFSENFHFAIRPDKSGEYGSGVHTINVLDDIIVIDGIKMLFKPLTKLKLFFKKRFVRQPVVTAS